MSGKDNSPKEIGTGSVPEDGDILIYNATTEKWEASTFAALMARIVADQAFLDAVDAIVNP